MFDMKALNSSKTVNSKWPHRLQSAIKGHRREKHARTSAGMKAAFYICKIDGLDTRPALKTVHRPRSDSQRPRPGTKGVLNGLKSRPGLNDIISVLTYITNNLLELVIDIFLLLNSQFLNNYEV